jgi:molybdate transport system regulatory protein
MLTPVIRFRIHFAKDSSVGPGKIQLLEQIKASGSLSQAARNIGMSYRRAWLLLESLKNAFRQPVTVAKTGGKGGGGVETTAFGESLIKSYRALDHDIAEAATRHLRAITPSAVGHPKTSLEKRRRARVRKSNRSSTT